MDYLRRLSRRQRVWLAATLFAMALIVAVGWAVDRSGKSRPTTLPSIQQSIRQIAPTVGATGFAIAKELKLSRKADKDASLESLGIRQEQLDHVALHLLSHRGRKLKYFVYSALVLFGLVFLTQLGRPDGSPPRERKSWYPQAVYRATLIMSVAICGFALGKSPNPMEGAVKVFKAMVGLQPSVWAVVLALLFFLALAIVGNKLICGWACPMGALQELIYSVPLPRRWQGLQRMRRRKVPFLFSSLIRGGLFLLMLLLMFGVVGGRKGFVLYHFINTFNLFNLDFDPVSILFALIVTLGLALLVYRPFCQFVCPFGFVSWLAERLSLVGIRVDHNLCNSCGSCSSACPVEAASHKVEGRLFAADCYSCARCLTVCPHEAIDYGPMFVSRKPQEEPAPQETAAPH
jgi:ferredoxin